MSNIIIFKRLLRVRNSHLAQCIRSYEQVSPKEADEHEARGRVRLHSFGLSEHGALGLIKPGSDFKLRKYITKPMRHFFADECKLTGVACGYGFTVFSADSRDNAKLYGCGISTDSQIGKHKKAIVSRPMPIDLGLKPDTNIISMSAGRAHVGIMTNNEGLFMLGNNSYGQCGLPLSSETEDEIVQTRIEELDNELVKDVVCGQDHTSILMCDGRVFSCGMGSDGQTGQNNTNNITEPTVIKELEKEKIVKISGSCDTVLALNEQGVLFGWGSSEYMQLSKDKSVRQVNKPIRLDIEKKCGEIIDMAAGGSFCVVLNSRGQVFVWGFGIIGAGPKLEISDSPVLLPETLFGANEFQPDAKVVSVHCGYSHLAAITNYRHLYTWGKNRFGCLGIGHTKDQYFPYKVAVSDCILNVCCGIDHTMVLSKPFST